MNRADSAALLFVHYDYTFVFFSEKNIFLRSQENSVIKWGTAKKRSERYCLSTLKAGSTSSVPNI
ncbi:hypothetical protein EV146_107285 [Mesobacillus foraminis]|uniref:Uncharacterized protein n=1 Tax=Mesobacillus foraminis TaxID=279826 RepID=A0A4V2RDE9_9BACI|nr:hypothetical protein EV146_107285 [Mesobacillus foraminis]